MTQAERREATRTALLEATIECLVDYGYTNTTTGRVAELAGVSRGAQLTYFANKSDLVAAAIAHLAQKRIAWVGSLVDKLPEGEDRLPTLLDLLWDAHQGDLFVASVELWVGARADPQLSSSLVEVERDVLQRSLAVAADALPELSSRAGFVDDVEAVLSLIRGLGLLQVASGEDRRGVARRWPATRERILRILAAD
ncbi:MAG: TetR/AcrR family transcriptional regulator [Solirubrobacteraceae bacterium]|nr:TetR/AcrR family transcriptional regulator [Solirubrobacteraceae bacterium]